MTEHTHTSGPWHRIHTAIYAPVKSTTPALVATANSSFVDGVLVISEAEALKNAQFIAAAPDMLEALESCKIVLSKAKRGRLERDGLYQYEISFVFLVATLLQIKDAIAKAQPK